MPPRVHATCLTLFLLSACLPAAPAADPADACGAVARIGLVGVPVARAEGLPPGARIIRPGDAVTEEFSAGRLNVYLDGRDIITSLTCG